MTRGLIRNWVGVLCVLAMALTLVCVALADDLQIHPRAWELTNPKPTLVVPVAQTITPNNVYYSPEIQIVPGKSYMFDANITQASSTINMTVTVLCGVQSGRTTTATDLTSSGLNLAIGISGTSPQVVCTPLKLPNAKFFRFMYKNSAGVNCTLNSSGLGVN